MSQYKLITLNCEGDKHWDKIIPLLERESPDVICFQEVFESDLTKLESLGYHSSFLQMSLMMKEGAPEAWGVAILTKSETPIVTHARYYLRPAEHFVLNDTTVLYKTMHYGVLWGNFIHDDTEYTIATTHFVWTPAGETNEVQEGAFVEMLGVLETIEPHVLVGDFNVPRGYNRLYPKMIEHYTDAIPASYKSSMDKDLHRFGNNPEKTRMFTDYMVDYVFSQPPYAVSDVRLEFGVSDHAAVVASVVKG